MVPLGRQRGPGGNIPNGAPAARPTNRLCQQPQGPAVLQNLVSQGVHRRFGISGVEFCDDHHTLPPVFFVALPPVLGPLPSVPIPQ